MLSIGKLAAGRADYYLATVAKGAEEYYLGSGKRPAAGSGGVPSDSASPARSTGGCCATSSPAVTETGER